MVWVRTLVVPWLGMNFFIFLRNLGATYVIYLEYGFEILQAEIKQYYPTLILFF